jgi:hypothetical protein
MPQVWQTSKVIRSGGYSTAEPCCRSVLGQQAHANLVNLVNPKTYPVSSQGPHTVLTKGDLQLTRAHRNPCGPCATPADESIRPQRVTLA